MKIGISNLAWLKRDNLKIINNLKKKKISFLEYSYHKLINFHPELKVQEIRKFYIMNKISLYSMQSLFFKSKNCYIFGSQIQRNNFITELKKKICIAKKLKTKILVFGSPKNKKNISLLTKEEMFKIFKDEFSKLSGFCKNKGVCICIEANPKFYKTDFLIYTKDALDMVKKIDSPNIKLNFDLGTVISNREKYKTLLKENVKFIGHIQVSLPKLKKITCKNKKIADFFRFLKKIKYKEAISIEQIHSKKNNIKNVTKAINFISNLSK